MIKHGFGVCVLLWAGLSMACGSGGGEDSTASEPAQAAGVEATAIDASDLTASTGACLTDQDDFREGEILVQVFLAGLSVYNFDRGASTDPGVFFPQEGHVFRIGHGAEDGGHLVWNWKGTYSERTFRVSSADPFERVQTVEDWPGNDMGIPDDGCAAKDSRWLVNAWQLGGKRGEITFFQDKAEGNWLDLNASNLETCALVFDTRFDGSCKLKASRPMTKFVRSVGSEVMVLRHSVKLPDEGDTVPVLEVQDGEKWTPLDYQWRTIGTCNGNSTDTCVTWNGDHYAHVVDVILENNAEAAKGDEDDHSGRLMKSVHGDAIKGLFARREFNDWDVEAMQCTGKPGHETCDCSGPQPACWSYLKEFSTPELDANGVEKIVDYPTNVAICPMVEYP